MKKDITLYIIFSLLNLVIAYLITSFLGIKNIIIVKTYSVMFGNITTEVIIWLALILMEGYIYTIATKKDEA